MPEHKVAFITGATRGIGAESAVALARAGYRVAITARTLSDGESHDHVGNVMHRVGVGGLGHRDDAEGPPRAVEQHGEDFATSRSGHEQLDERQRAGVIGDRVDTGAW